MAGEAAHSIILSSTPVQAFEGHEGGILAVAVFPDRRRMVTGSCDRSLLLWDLKSGTALKEMKGHCEGVRAVAVAGHGQLIASGGLKGELIAWDGDTGESLIQAIRAHSRWISSLDFSPDGTVLATGSWDKTTKLWCTETWQPQGNPIDCGDDVFCVRYSPSEHLAIATEWNIQIINPGTRQSIAKLEIHVPNISLAWTPGGTRLLSGSTWDDPTVQEWDPSTWNQVGHPWKGHTGSIFAIAINSTGTLVASASYDHYVRLWRLSDRRTIAMFKHSSCVNCLTFSTDGKEILSGGDDRKISKWTVPEDALPCTNGLALNLTASNAALLHAEMVIDSNPSSYHGYRLQHAALHDAKCYGEAIAACEIMLSKLENASNTQIRRLRRRYRTSSEVKNAIRKAIHAQLDNTPLRVLDTATGLLCDRQARISFFETSTKYNELLSFTMMHPDLPIEDVALMHCVMLSHRWQGNEPLLRDIQDRNVYGLNPVGSVVKLQSFCKVARDAGYRWAWSDTCCIDKTNNVELQESLNSMFVWYRHSALTIIYLADVRPSSKSGALANSEWNMRGWTVGEFLAPKIVLFYQKDWTLYLNDHTPNHKQSVVIMQELGRAMGIDRRTLIAFSPGMSRAREKLQWASMRVTTLQEDIAYSLFGIFGIHLPIIYGEKKQNALGRLLQEIVAQSGDITALDWVGKPSGFNSCLPDDITSYKAPQCMLPSLPEDEMQTLVSFLRNAVTVELASEIYTLLDTLSPPRFSNRRLHLPCIVFRVTTIRRKRDLGQEASFTYEVKADGLHDLLITTSDKPNQFSRAMPINHLFLLVRPWNRYLLELPDSADDMQSVANWSAVGSSLYNVPSPSQSPASRFIPRLGQPFGSLFRGSPGENGPLYSESHLQALRLIVHLGQPFSAFLLAPQPGGEYKRIASDCNIVAQVKDVTSVRSMMDVRTLEIL